MNNKKRHIKRKKKKKDITSLIIIIIAAILLIIGIILLINYARDYKKGQQVYEEISNEYVVPDEGDKWYNMIDINISELKKINPDTKGWIYFENGEISYPIVQAADNDYYLHTSFEGEELRAGSIFLEMLCKDDFSDTNSIIYGHNMRDLSMFGKLQRYKYEENYYKDNLYFQIITADKVYRFQIFAFNDVDDDSDVYTITFATDKEYVDYIRMVKQLSQANISVPDVADPEATPDEQILSNYKKLVTLSTCTASDDMRFAVIGTIVGEYDRAKRQVVMDNVGK